MVGVRGGVSADDRAAIAAAAREQALREGYTFTELRLLNPAYNGMLGAQVLSYTSRLDHATGQRSFSFKVDGGPLRFELDVSRNGRFHWFVDSEHNRKALPGYVEAGIVEVASAPMMSKEEYLMKLAEMRAAEAAEGEAVAETAAVPPVDLPRPPLKGGSTAPVSAARKASAPPVGSPLVQIADEG